MIKKVPRGRVIEAPRPDALEKDKFYLAFGIGAGARLGGHAFDSPEEAQEYFEWFQEHGFISSATIIQISSVIHVGESE